MKKKLFVFKIIILSVFFFFVFLLLFSLYKLGVLFGLSLVVTIVAAGLLLITIAYCLHHASQRLIVKRKPSIAYFFTDELKGWAQRQYAVMNAFLSLGMLSAFVLSFLGISTAWIRLTHPVVGILDMVISTFGLIVACLGIAFVALFLKEFGFMRKNKSVIIEKIFQQAQAPREVIPQYPDT